MSAGRYDIALVGVDPALPREEVVSNLSRRLVKSADEIEELLARAPAPLLRSVSRDEAERLIAELRGLGARVKPQDEAAYDGALPAPESEAAIERAQPALEDELEDRPPLLTLRDPDEPPDPGRAREPIADPLEASALEPDPSVVAEASPSEPPTPIVVHPDADWAAPKSLASTTFAAEPQPKVAPKPLVAAPSSARRGRAEVIVWDDAPRFSEGLARALRAPFRRELALPLAAAPLLGALALALVVFGLRAGDEGPLWVALGVAAGAGFAGVSVQLASSCFARTARVTKTADHPLPSRLVADYLAPGIWLLIAYGAAAWLVASAYTVLSMPLFVGLASLVASYGTFSFGLVAANGSALALLDVGHVVSLLARGRLRALVVLSGGVPLIGGVAGAAVLLHVSATTRTLQILVANVAIFGTCSAAAVVLGASLTGSLLALLVRAHE